MSKKMLMVSALIGVLLTGFAIDSSAHGRRWHRGPGYGPRHVRPLRVWVAPPPPPRVVVVAPGYGPRYHARPRFYRSHPRFAQRGYYYNNRPRCRRW